MHSYLKLVFSYSFLLCLSTAAWAQTPNLIEAEADPKGTVVSDSNASGGKYVTSDRSYQPLLITPLPADGNIFTIWVRYRGTGVQLKGVAGDGSQKPLNWIYDQPSSFRWASFGKHTRSELGNQILIMRGSSATAGSGVDAVVITSNSSLDPVTAFPNLIETPIQKGPTPSNTAPLAANIRIDWKTKIARSTPLTFGSNDFQIIYPQANADTQYHALLGKIGLRFLRFHHGNLSNAWSDSSTRSWKSDVIAAAYDSYGPHPPVIIQNIPGWPRWMKQDKGMLDPSEVDNYAQFAADLVRIINRDQHRGIRYWEPLNEQDTAYKRAGKIDQLWNIYNKTAKAMKAVDPSIQVGGPALTYDDTNALISFLKACGGNADFISWHRYASGNSKDSTDQIMAYTPKYAEQINNFRSLTQRTQPNRKIGLLLGEYNIDYDYRSGENRQNTQEGAAWFASVLKYLAESGIDMATSWNAKDGFYGLIDNARNPNLRPSAQVFLWANRNLVGDVIRTTSDQLNIEAFAVRQKNGLRSLLLINKSGGSANIQIQGERGIVATERLETSTLTTQLSKLSNPIVISPYGVVLLKLPKEKNSPPLPLGFVSTGGLLLKR
ncbi:MAG: hypothetical protein H7Y37_07335 [Anaerolineae bacterium]|nr:hypothetical protein [Gloeobacterales cyanobacterium ES-bin-313]